MLVALLARTRRALIAVAIVPLVVLALPGQAAAEPDTTPPVIDIDIPPSHGTGVWSGWYRAAVEITGRASDPGGSGIATLSISLAGAQTGSKTGTSPTTSTTISNVGVTTVTFTATDAAGNVTHRTYGVGVDLTNPTTDATGFAPSPIIAGDQRRVTASCRDDQGAIVSCTATIDGTPFTSGGLLDTTVGVHTLRVTAVDRVGRTRQDEYVYRVAPKRTVVAPPAVSGHVRVGSTVSLKDAVVSPTAPRIETSWEVGGESISQSHRLTLTREHLGKRLRCYQAFVEHGQNVLVLPCRFADGATSVVVEDVAWKVLRGARIAGKAKVGVKLRAVLPRLSAPAATHRYQWLRNGKAIKNATAATYRLTKRDRGKAITLRVTSTATNQPTLTSVSAPRRVRR